MRIVLLGDDPGRAAELARRLAEQGFADGDIVAAPAGTSLAEALRLAGFEPPPA